MVNRSKEFGILRLHSNNLCLLFLQAQYIFIHDATLESLVCGETVISVTNFRLTWNKLSRIDKETGKTGLESQYQVGQTKFRFIFQHHNYYEYHWLYQRIPLVISTL